MRRYLVPFRIHPSGWLTVLLCLAVGYEFGGPSKAILIGFLLLASLLVHECGHIVMARTLHVPVHELGLRMMGAYNRRTYASRRRDEVLISSSGPLANFALALVFLQIPTIGSQLALCNLMLGLVNLVPIPGSDGLRIWRMIRSTGRPAEIALAHLPAK